MQSNGQGDSHDHQQRQVDSEYSAKTKVARLGQTHPPDAELCPVSAPLEAHRVQGLGHVVVAVVAAEVVHGPGEGLVRLGHCSVEALGGHPCQLDVLNRTAEAHLALVDEAEKVVEHALGVSDGSVADPGEHPGDDGESGPEQTHGVVVRGQVGLVRPLDLKGVSVLALGAVYTLYIHYYNFALTLNRTRLSTVQCCQSMFFLGPHNSRHFQNHSYFEEKQQRGFGYSHPGSSFAGLPPTFGVQNTVRYLKKRFRTGQTRQKQVRKRSPQTKFRVRSTLRQCDKPQQESRVSHTRNPRRRLEPEPRTATVLLVDLAGPGFQIQKCMLKFDLYKIVRSYFLKSDLQLERLDPQSYQTMRLIVQRCKGTPVFVQHLIAQLKTSKDLVDCLHNLQEKHFYNEVCSIYQHFFGVQQMLQAHLVELALQQIQVRWAQLSGKRPSLKFMFDEQGNKVTSFSKRKLWDVCFLVTAQQGQDWHPELLGRLKQKLLDQLLSPSSLAFMHFRKHSALDESTTQKKIVPFQQVRMPTRRVRTKREEDSSQRRSRFIDRSKLLENEIHTLY